MHPKSVFSRCRKILAKMEAIPVIHKQRMVFLMIMELMMGGCFTTQPVSDAIPSGFLEDYFGGCRGN